MNEDVEIVEEDEIKEDIVSLRAGHSWSMWEMLSDKAKSILEGAPMNNHNKVDVNNRAAQTQKFK